MTAYYSEFDPKAAAWLRELIKEGHIADGEVDERDLWDVTPDDLRGFGQVHLCAGIGVWSYSLRRSGWPDDRPVWTASFPCQPFSAAGKGEGFADERHLWPAGCHLIGECRPRVLFGEQVANKDAEPWLDLVQTDLEGLGYAFGACAFPSAGIGAPHIRDRTYWTANRLDNNNNTGLEGHWSGHQATNGWDSPLRPVASPSEFNRLADNNSGVSPQGRSVGGRSADRSNAFTRTGPSGSGKPSQLENATSQRLGRFDSISEDIEAVGIGLLSTRSSSDVPARQPASGPTNGLWRDADWLFCRDGKWRPVEPGTFPLAYGSPARVGRLRGYGNAINAEAATAWIESYLDTQTIEA